MKQRQCRGEKHKAFLMFPKITGLEDIQRAAPALLGKICMLHHYSDPSSRSCVAMSDLSSLVMNTIMRLVKIV